MTERQLLEVGACQPEEVDLVLERLVAARPSGRLLFMTFELPAIT